MVNPLNFWKPIASAPLDGTWVLLRGGLCVDESDDPDRPVTAQYSDYLNGRTSPKHERWMFGWFDSGYVGEYRNPTHWAPIP